MVKSIPEFLIEYGIYDDRTSYVRIVESLQQQVSNHGEFDSPCRIFGSCDTKSIFADSISSNNFIFSLEVELTDYKSSSLGTIETSSIDSALTMPFVEDIKVENVSTKVTCIGSLFLNMIIILLFLGDKILI